MNLTRTRTLLAGIILAGGAALTAAPALATAAPPAAITPAAPMGMELVAVPGHPATMTRIGVGPYTLCLKNGNHYCVGADSIDAGNAVRNKVTGRSVYYDFIGFNSHGKPQNYWEFANGNLMAASTSGGCGGITIKSSPGSNGTVWVSDGAGTQASDAYLSRYCNTDLTSDNALNTQLFLAIGIGYWTWSY